MKYETFIEASMGRRIGVLSRLTMTYIRSEMKKKGFGAGDYPFLALLFLKEGLSQDELSKFMRVDKSYTARAVARLEKIGMVERRQDPDEHRIKRVFLSRKSKKHEADFFNMLFIWQQTLTRGIEPEKQNIIREGLDKMVHNAEDYLGLSHVQVTAVVQDVPCSGSGCDKS